MPGALDEVLALLRDGYELFNALSPDSPDRPVVEAQLYRLQQVHDRLSSQGHRFPTPPERSTMNRAREVITEVRERSPSGRRRRADQ